VVVAMNIFVVRYMPILDFQSYIFAITFATFLVSVVSSFSNTTIITANFSIEEISVILFAQIGFIVSVFIFSTVIIDSFDGLMPWTCLFAISQIVFLHNQTFFQRKLLFCLLKSLGRTDFVFL